MSTGYIIRFTLIMTSLVALLLSGMYSVLKETHDANADLFSRRAILKAIDDYLPEKEANMSDAQVNELFENQIQQYVVNNKGELLEGLIAENIDMAKEKKKAEDSRIYPLFVYDSPEGKFYLLSVRGNGLWDAIWGTIAIKSDFNTVVGVAFDHQGETPGLGAEIKDNPGFPNQFKGKKLFTDDGQFVSINVRKGGAKDPIHDVDAISGATVTCVGVTDMLYNGIAVYQPYLEKLKSEGKPMGSLK